MAALAEEMAISAATVEALQVELASLPEPTTTPPPPPPPTRKYKFVPKLPAPLSLADEKDLKSKVLRRLVSTLVVDAGASSNCGAAPLVSECGEFTIQRDPFISTGVKSDKIFRDAGGRLDPAT